MIGRLSRRLEWSVVLPALALQVLGVVFVHSATADAAASLWVKQVAFCLAGLAAAWVVMQLGTRLLLEASWEIYGALLAVLLVLPLLPGSDGVATARWIPLPFGFKLQPSEFMKLGLVLALARHLRHRGVTNTWRSYLGPFLVLVVPWFLVMRQPDLGSSLVMLPVALAMVTVSGARPLHVVTIAGLSVALLLAAYLVPGVLQPYQKDRLDAFRTSIPALVTDAGQARAARDVDGSANLEAEISEFRRGLGYQQYYSVVAIGSGGLYGAGLGHGLQNRTNRVPVRHSDFVMAVVGEEGGLVLSGLVLLLHVALLSAILGVAHRTREPFGRLVCVGVAALVGGQALMNVGIATALLPVTGLTLPLVSYGGSSMLSTCMALGCVLDVAARRTTVFFEQ